ncbi:MAG TPA: GGDEF domain-containing protein [Acidimicrobiales bacterium]|nr:GGDEF domain-containing protein [Acidimicrobiales bacterium]
MSAFADETRAVQGGIEFITEAFEAEVGALIDRGRVLAARGFPADRTPNEMLVESARGDRDTVEIPGVGHCAVLCVPINFSRGSGDLLVGRSGSPFSREESSLLRAMARVLSLTLHNLRVVASLRARQELLERLVAIQRSISTREPVTGILDAITESTSALLGGELVTIHFRETDDPGTLTAVSTYGVPESRGESLAQRIVGEGAVGRAVAENSLVVIEDYQSNPDAVHESLAFGVQAAMAAPVHDHGETVGGMTTSSLAAGRQYSMTERELLLSFAELASLALTDARTVDALHWAVDDALHRALHDPLTGLANRTRLLDRLDNAFELRQHDEYEVSVLYVDLDDFKTINDQFGHSTGDRVLVAAAEQLLASVGEHDTVARIGGDEFAVLIESLGDPAVANRTAERILNLISARSGIGSTGVSANASIGIAFSSAETRSPEEVLRNADIAMYQAKGAGKGRAVTFEAAMYEDLLGRIELEADLRRAVENDELEIYFQPIVSLEDQRIVGAETLARWQHPTRGWVTPLTFIPLAETTGLILPLGSQILQKACIWFGNWQAAHPQAPRLGLSVNVSAWQIQRPEFADEVVKAIAGTGVAPSTLILEITESVLMQDVDSTLTRLHELNGMGLRLAIDDFGTGFSALSYLRRFPVDFLKIDQSFVAALRSGEQTIRQLTEAILVLGSSLGIECIAEGVEDAAELNALRDLGCRWGQGWYLGAPMPPDEFGEYLASYPLGAMPDPVPRRATRGLQDQQGRA